MTKRAGEKEGSGLMKANAWHHRADAISSVVALVGVGKASTNSCPSILQEGKLIVMLLEYEW
jgi:divalent metal cation (Fe/Co/Zn/Cd) transporter